MNFAPLRDFILDKLRTGLRHELYYHSIDHTLDVYDAVMRLAKLENLDAYETEILKTAALLHDAGMLITYAGHEEASAEMARSFLPQYGYDETDITLVVNLILDTRMPQQAGGKLGQILCDADLDYLGRDDYFLISHRLRLEWIRTNLRQTTLRQWYELQVNFLQSHHYFCESSQQLRNQGKQNNLEQIKNLLGIY
ncbi:MAG: HD domain-containing protein [Bacteroidales bacterium]|jgi:predicted metal-dependent HD superfamily phosphohydrolase|nr:HD domain-containing protein [Bacteroidales bacterium]NPV37200.1 HD domain-containing protein [Bacteroidales bacterium]